jgi:mevalonate kinase
MSDAEEMIPSQSLPVVSRSPGKCIVFGEHAVVHGAPELVFALDLHTQVHLRGAEGFSLNADPHAAEQHPYFRTALARRWVGGSPVEVRSTSRIPRGAGLGSSAAFCSALVAGFGAAQGGLDRAALAQASYDVEKAAQGGVGSPGDTSTVAAGGFVTINGALGDRLWTINGSERDWEVRRVADPGWVWVVAHSGIPRATGDAVRKVAQRLTQPDGPTLLAEFARVATAGIKALVAGDRASVAAHMGWNQELLRTIGVSHPRLEALLEAAAPAAEGAKLTGAGAGGSIVALPKPGEEVDLVRRLARAGGLPFVVRPSSVGTTLVGEPVA